MIGSNIILHILKSCKWFCASLLEFILNDMSKCHIFPPLLFFPKPKPATQEAKSAPVPHCASALSLFIDIKQEKVISFNAEPLLWEVYFKLGLAFEMLEPYFKSGWGRVLVGQLSLQGIPWNISEHHKEDRMSEVKLPGV